MAKPDQTSEWLLLSPPIAKMWAIEQTGGPSDRRIWTRLRPKPVAKITTENPHKGSQD